MEPAEACGNSGRPGTPSFASISFACFLFVLVSFPLTTTSSPFFLLSTASATDNSEPYHTVPEPSNARSASWIFVTIAAAGAFAICHISSINNSSAVAACHSTCTLSPHRSYQGHTGHTRHGLPFWQGRRSSPAHPPRSKTANSIAFAPPPDHNSGVSSFGLGLSTERLRRPTMLVSRIA